MARNQKPKGKIVRRFGVNIYGNVKFDRLLERKPHGPGADKGRRSRNRVSDYGMQLLEKQKIRFTYGISERQFYNLFLLAKRRRGLTGENMMVLLERRLDNVVYRLGMAISRAQARQFVSHGHIRLNDGRSDIPSMRVKAGDTIEIKSADSSTKIIRRCLTRSQRQVPIWLTIAEDDLRGTVVRLPYRDDIETIANEQSVVEFYSR